MAVTLAWTLPVGAAAGCTADGVDGEEPPAIADGTDPGTIVRPGAPGQPSELLDELPAAPDVRPDAADVAFIADMRSHHAQALEMTALVPGRSDSRDTVLLSERIEASQEAEIALLDRYLAVHAPDRSSGNGGHGDHDGMPGMLTAAELAELASLSGAEFDRALVEAMIRHHLGAITMVDDYEAQGPVDDRVEQLAGHLRAEQESEILRMQALLAELDGR